jgi:hypothetical protein
VNTKRFKVKGKYLYTFVNDSGVAIFYKTNTSNLMMWTKSEISYIEKVMTALGEQYVRDYYCK